MQTWSGQAEVFAGPCPAVLTGQIWWKEYSMELLKERIRRDGVMKAGNVLKVDSFVNHQMDIKLMNEIGKEFKRRFADVPVDKILTIEASGIGIAAITAQYFDNCPMVFAKKSESINLDGEMFTNQIESFTHKRVYNVIVAKKYINPGENILIIDDFMANGCAARGLIGLVEAAGAKVQGVGIVIEKGFQSGGQMIRDMGIKVESLAIVESMDPENQTITFRD